MNAGPISAVLEPRPAPGGRRCDQGDTHLPRRVGAYEIGEEVGRGAASRVFAARRFDSPHPLAFKELRRRPGDTRSSQQFLTEARILGSIDHPHVITMHDVIDDGVNRALVLDLVARGSLRRHIRAGLGLAQVGCVLEDVLSGLAHLEGQRIVHLDIKPDNLLVTSSGAITIADFGVAQEVGPGREAHPQLVGGTPQYLAPEQAVGAPMGAWTDLYAVGILTFEMLVGRPPFADTRDPVEIVARHLHCRVPPVCELLPGMSTTIADWIDRLVAKSPSDRPASALEAWDELARLLTGCLGASWRLAGGW